jgi:hypothetical protein
MSAPADGPLDANVQWLPCPGCSGEIGVPPHWLAHTVACPKCGAIVSISQVERVLWRPPNAPTDPAALRGLDAIAVAPSIPAAAAENTGHPIRWRLHVWTWALSFVAMVSTAVVTLAISPFTAGELSVGAIFLSALASLGGILLGLVSLGCWGVLLVTMMRHNRTLGAVVLLLILPIGYVISFLYGWAKAGVIPVAKPMLIWTYCLVLGFCLGVASFAAMFLASTVFALEKPTSFDPPIFHEEHAVELALY